MEKAIKNEPKPVELIYIGIRESVKGKRLYCWATFPSLDTQWLWDKNYVPASVGGIYSFHETVDNAGNRSVYHTGIYEPKFLRHYENKEQVIKWSLQDDAIAQNFSSKSLNTKAAKIEPLDQYLEQLRLISQKLNLTERRTLMSKISEMIFS